jgi:hypothetical protein
MTAREPHMNVLTPSGSRTRSLAQTHRLARQACPMRVGRGSSRSGASATTTYGLAAADVRASESAVDQGLSVAPGSGATSANLMGAGRSWPELAGAGPVHGQRGPLHWPCAGPVDPVTGPVQASSGQRTASARPAPDPVLPAVQIAYCASSRYEACINRRPQSR